MSTFKHLCMASAAVAGLMSGFAQAQTSDQPGNYYSRDKYEAVRDRVQPEFDPEPIRLGAFVVKSNVEAGLTSTSNAFASDSNEQSDIIARVGVEAAARTDWSVHQLGFDASAFRNEYLDFSDESTTDVSLRGLGRLDATRELSIGGEVFFDDRSEARTDFANAVGIDSPVEYQRSGAGVDVNYTNDRVRWTNGLQLAEWDYQDGRAVGSGAVIDQDFRDVKRLEGRTRLAYAVSPNVAVYGQATYGESEFDNPEFFSTGPRKRDSEGYTIAAGVDFELTSLVRGDIAVGFLNEDKKDNFFKDVDGLMIDGRMQWFPSRLTTVSFDAARRVADVGVPEAPSALYTSAGVRVDHELRRNIIVSGFGSVSNLDFEENGRNDDVLDFGASATYKMNKRVHVEGFVRRLDRDISNGGIFADSDYGINLIGVKLKLHP